MSRNGFLPLLTARSTPSASLSILAAVFLETASLRGATLILLGLGACLRSGFLLRLARFLLHRLLLFLELRRRHLVRHCQEFLLDRRRTLAGDLADRLGDFFDVQLEDAAPLRLVVGGL